MGTVIDAAQIAKFCDGSIITVVYNTVSREELINTKAQLEQTGCPILGTVLNQVALDSYVSRKYYKNSYYKYEYQSEPETNPKLKGHKHKK